MAGEVNRLVAELGASRDQLRTIIENMVAGVIALDPEGRIVAVNSTARELLDVGDEEGTLPSEHLARRLPTLFDSEPSEVRLERAGRIPRIVAKRAGVTPDGSRVVLLHDITEQRRAETIRRDFVANASHELRTPVAVIQANAETLLGGALDEPAMARRFVDGIHRHAKRLSALLGDLLDLSRIEAGRYAVDPVPLSVAEAFARARETVANRASAAGVVVVLRAPEGLTLIGDHRALDQILVNLLDNAVKYAPEGSTVTLAGEARGDFVRLELRDSGPGIPAEHRERLFERFYRVDPGRDRRIGGTGLGLAIVKHLAGVMRGSVGMEPNEPRGSVFWVSLPAA
jgi:two-component system phosphate regulon sensor histidine kinase PhoR